MSKANEISCSKLERKVGTKVEVIVDQIDEDAAICRTKADAPEIDGNLFIDKNFSHLNPGDLLTVKVDEASEYDLWGAEVRLKFCKFNNHFMSNLYLEWKIVALHCLK